MGAVRAGRAVIARSPELRAAVDGALGRGNAVDAVCTGLLLACAQDASVAMGSVSVVVAGFGMAPRLLDGRVLEPGNLARRPRGYRSDEAVPSAAYVAAPRLFATVAAALTLAGRRTFAAAASPAVSACGNPARKVVLEAFSALGAALFQRRGLADELFAAAGPGAGGALAPADLEVAAPSPVALAARCDEAFAAPVLGPCAFEDSAVEWIGARDGAGLVCLASFERAAEGHELSGLGLVAPRVAVPVRRGIPRVTPTTALGLLPPVRAVQEGGALAFLEALEGPVAALASLARRGEPVHGARVCEEHPLLQVVRVARD